MLNKNNHSYNQHTLKLAEECSDTINISIKQNATVHIQVTINNDNSKNYGEWSKDYWDNIKLLLNL